MIERYLEKKIADVFTDESRFQTYLEVEIASLEAWNKLSVVSDEELSAIKKKAVVDVKRIQEIEAVTHHDVVAFTRQIDEKLGEEKKWFHYGLTSTDVVDTSLSIMYQKADNLIQKDFEALIESLKEKALEYKTTPCIARTHGMQAEVTSFGLKWLSFYEEMKNDLTLFIDARKHLEAVKMSGAVGNYANVDPFVQEYVGKKFSLEDPIVSTQVLSRDRHEVYASALAISSSTIERICTEIRNLSRSEIAEVEEGFSKGQKGSSAMPQKRNPISSENLTGCARMMRGYLLPILEDNALYHERDISHSSVERVAFIDMIELFDYMLVREKKIVDNLTVFPKSMEKNISLSNGAIYSQRVLTELIKKGMSREKAYDLIQPMAMDALHGVRPFKEALLSSGEVENHMSKSEVEECFENSYYLRFVDYLFKRAGL
ncbi:MAG: adenylosuccinate lyase [Bacilli bacterium]|jgi:adenylosuccinate lyase|nr:adenylosuccinate lyase [Bacilli bacterium]MCH4210266.1 adenylosuccinate lyase [Bacilli bacterium]MCH4228202.1 adenylosuccinate lyase [Bacilli bacterium]MCH4277444.1 adenylosuccinate lyase [Bacilli bacterium]MCI2054654.1 adenylosuccinate lyase [Bacilli bacterium]